MRVLEISYPEPVSSHGKTFRKEPGMQSIVSQPPLHLFAHESEPSTVRPRMPLEHLAAATGGARLYALTLAYLHSGLVVHRRCAHSLFDLSRHGQEGLLNITGVLGGSLQERNAETVSKFLFCITSQPPYLYMKKDLVFTQD